MLHFAAENDLPGIYNAAGDGVLALSEVASLLGKPLAPILPPWGTALAAAALRPTGVRVPTRGAQPAALRPRARQPQAQGRGLQLRLHEPRGGAKHARGAARARLQRGSGEPYRYEREVEEFLRWSPSVRRKGTV